MANAILGLIILLLPLYTRVTSIDFTRMSKDNFLVILLPFVSLFLREKKRNINKFIVVAFVYSMIMIVYNQHNVLSPNVILQFFYVSSGLIFFMNYFQKFDENSIDNLLYGMIAGSLVQSIIIICQYFGFEIYYIAYRFIFGTETAIISPGSGISNTVGSFGNNNLSGSYLALTSLAFFRIKKWWIIIIPIIALLLTHSMMGIFSFIAGILYYLNTKLNIVKKAVIYISAIVAMVSMPFINYDFGDSARFYMWKKMLSLVDLEHFLIGKGVGWYPDQKVAFSNSQIFYQEHNEYIATFNILGIIVFIMILPFFIKFIKTKDKHKIFSSILFVAFCNSYGHFSLHQSSTALIIILTAAICFAEGSDNGFNMEWKRTTN